MAVFLADAAAISMLGIADYKLASRDCGSRNTESAYRTKCMKINFSFYYAV